MKHLKRYNESKKDKSEISEIIKRKNSGEKLTDDELYLLHTHFYETSKEYKDFYNNMVDELLKKDK